MKSFLLALKNIQIFWVSNQDYLLALEYETKYTICMCEVQY